MYFLNLKGLLDSIKTNKDFHKQSYKYLIAAVILNVAASPVFRGSGTAEIEWTIPVVAFALTAAAVCCAIAYAILTYFHQSNGGEDGDYFLDKLFQIGWVVSWRATIVVLPSMAIFAGLATAGLAMAVPTLAVLFLVLCLIVGLAGLIYLPVTIGRSFKDIRAHELSKTE